MKLRLVVTGSGGNLGQELIVRLGRDPDCNYILGLDIRPRSFEVACQAEFTTPLTGTFWALRLSPYPAGILGMIRYPWGSDVTRLKTVFRYTPRYASRQVLEMLLAARQTLLRS
jgi:hypothetical protein